MITTCANCGAIILPSAGDKCPQCKTPVGALIANAQATGGEDTKLFKVVLGSKRGKFIFQDGRLQIHTRSFFHWRLQQEIPLEQIVNVDAIGKAVAFQVEQNDPSGTRFTKIAALACNANEAAEIAGLLPMTQTPDFAAQMEGERAKHAQYAAALGYSTSRAMVTPILVALNVIVYVGMGLTHAGWFTIKIPNAIAWGADYSPLTTTGDWWRLLTSAFVHFGFLHIAFNMWALIQVGRFTERLFGSRFYFLIYLFGALGSGLASTWWDVRIVSAGASGAIFAVFGALLAYLVLHRTAFPAAVVKPLTRSTLVFIGYNIFYGMTNHGISNAAHLGGLASGIFMGAILCRPLDPIRRQRQLWPRLIAGTAIGAAVVGIGIKPLPRDYEGVLELGNEYNLGSDLPADPSKALQYYLRAAKGGNAEAMYNIGIFYDTGRSVPQDSHKAMEWFGKSADHGLAQAMNFMGSYYFDGKVVPQDFKLAMQWFVKAADEGDADAMYNIGLLYNRGLGVPEDSATARNWFLKADGKGSADARKWLTANPPHS